MTKENKTTISAVVILIILMVIVTIIMKPFQHTYPPVLDEIGDYADISYNYGLECFEDVSNIIYEGKKLNSKELTNCVKQDFYLEKAETLLKEFKKQELEKRELEFIKYSK